LLSIGSWDDGHTIVDRTIVYRNVDSWFTPLVTNLIGAHYSSAALGDVDQDGDLDLLLCGRTNANQDTTCLYRNNNPRHNTAPLPPTNVALAWVDGALQVDWCAGSDAETPAAGLSYNLRLDLLGTSRSLDSGMADAESGRRLLPTLGNAFQASSKTLRQPFLSVPILPQESRIVVAGVQAIDQGWASSVFARDTLVMNPEIEYLELRNAGGMRSEDLLSWSQRYADSLLCYEVQLAANPAFSLILGESRIEMDYAATRDVFLSVPLASLDGFAQLEANQVYYWRVRPVYADDRRATVFSATPGCFTFVASPAAPQHLCIAATGTTATLSWDAVTGGLVYYVVYTATDATTPFPAGWQAQTPTFQTGWTDAQATQARKFYRVQAVLLTE
jgi:hypothetical protein